MSNHIADRHTNFKVTLLVKGQVTIVWSDVFPLKLQAKHLISTSTLLLRSLSLVSRHLQTTRYIKCFTFNGIFKFHNLFQNLELLLVLELTEPRRMRAYALLTVYFPSLSFRQNYESSSCFWIRIVRIRLTSLSFIFLLPKQPCIEWRT